MDSQLYPLKMKPVFVEKIWGGRKLASEFGKSLPSPASFGESWEVADLPEGQSVIANGAHAGLTLRELISKQGEALVGVGRTTFPLLVKILDASADLSIQVHPGPEQAAKMKGANSKDESWLILSVDPGGSVFHGFEKDITSREFGDAINQGTIAELLRRVSVVPGQVLRVAPGTVHAICAGVTLLEVQEPSDTTFRVFDYNRPGLDGKMRDLHVESATKVANLCAMPLNSEITERSHPCGKIETLVDAGCYRMERLTLEGDVRLHYAEEARVLFGLEGGFKVNGVPLGAAETLILPASLSDVSIEGSGVIIGASPGTPVFLAD